MNPIRYHPYKEIQTLQDAYFIGALLTVCALWLAAFALRRFRRYQTLSLTPTVLKGDKSSAEDELTMARKSLGCSLLFALFGIAVVWSKLPR